MNRKYCKLLSLFTIMNLYFGINVAEKPIYDKHLIVLAVEVPPSLSVTRNATGHIEKIQGPMADTFFLIQRSLGFKFSFIKSAPGQVFEDSPTVSGWKHYMINNGVDIAIGPLIMFADRTTFMDYSYPLVFGKVQLIMPPASEEPNFGAPWKPFSSKVWILVLISISAIIAALTLIRRLHSINEISGSRNRYLEWSSDYVVQVLMAQGGFCLSTRLSIRTLAGVWCVAGFFLVNFYYSTFISHVSVSYRKPLLESVDDFPNKPNLRATVNYGLAVEKMIMAAETGALKYMGDMLRKYHTLRCQETEACVKEVISGTAVYMSFPEALIKLLKDDVDKTGKCRFTLLKSTFLHQNAGFAFPKNSPYRSIIDTIIIRIRSFGLHPSDLEMKLPPRYERCLITDQKPAKIQLTMTHLSSAFILLLIGYGFAIIVFIAESIWQRFKQHRRLLDQ